jgi:hypothetical protein
MYVEQLMREVMYMLLYGFEEHRVSFGDLHLANVGVRLSLEDFERVSWPLPAWDAHGFGREIIGVVCVDAEGVQQTNLEGKALNKLLKTFLTSFQQAVVDLRHPSWQPVVRAVTEPLTHYIANEAWYSQQGMPELRRQAAIMGEKVQGALSKAFASTVGVTPLPGVLTSLPAQTEAASSWQAAGERCVGYRMGLVVLLLDWTDARATFAVPSLFHSQGLCCAERRRFWRLRSFRRRGRCLPVQLLRRDCVAWRCMACGMCRCLAVVSHV